MSTDESNDLIKLGAAMALTGINRKLAQVAQETKTAAQEVISLTEQIAALEAQLAGLRTQFNDAQEVARSHQGELEQTSLAARNLLQLIAPDLPIEFLENGTVAVPPALAEMVDAALRLLPSEASAHSDTDLPTEQVHGTVALLYVDSIFAIFHHALNDMQAARKSEWNQIAARALELSDLSSNRNNATFKAVRPAYTALLLYRQGKHEPSEALKEFAERLQTEDDWNSFISLMELWRVTPTIDIEAIP